MIDLFEKPEDARQGQFLVEGPDLKIEAAAPAEDGKPRLARFEMMAYGGGAMRVAGWKYPVVVDFAGLSIPSQSRPTRLQHDPNQGVGHTDRIAVEGGKLHASGVISRDTAAAREVVNSSKNGFPWKASIGTSVEAYDFCPEGSRIEANGKTWDGPVIVHRKSTLGEISFVDTGADADATIKIAAAAHLGTGQTRETAMKTYEQWLEANGFDPKTVNDKQRPILEAQWKASEAPPASPPANPPAPPAAQTPPTLQAAGTTGNMAGLDAEIAEGRRRQTIEDMAVLAVRQANYDQRVSGQVRQLAAQAVTDGWTIQRLETEFLRAGRPHIQAGNRDTVLANPQETLQAAALLANGVAGDVVLKQLGEQAVNAADRQFGRNMGLQELMLLAARANGYTGRDRVTTSNWREVLSWAVPDHRLQAAGYSTVDLSGILGAVANKVMGAVALEPQWLAPRIAGVASHANFQTHTVYSLAMSGELQEVAPTGELKHISLGEENYTRQVKTRGAILRISRTDIVNDDMGVFARNAQALVRKALTTREKALFTAILVTGAGSTHFTAARGNYVAGTTTAFSHVGMGLAIKAFRGLKGPDGDPIMVEPAIVLVPPTLEQEAATLLAASSALILTAYGATNAKAVQSNANIYAGKFGAAPVSSPWMENTKLTGWSVAYWYLLANPAIYPCFEIAYLNGQQAPTVEYFGLDADPDTLGVCWRVYWDFGVSAAEYRAGVKMAGA